ncbi:hypothetical protein [Bacillus sp. 7894-2]|uniref:phosphoribosyltransferase-like protein n=1 Tax=Bacillus sp. 7894-2 TaxID=2021695 RepID=UPI000BA5A8FC|nr:hypothetical protein [Bacillus sp. 7894-2]PAE23883.1 hypothetical protein CHI10_15680 [Bacillus sp. 7894-2]
MNNSLSRTEEVVQSFIDKYGEEEYYTKNLHSKFISWLSNTEDQEVKDILIELFSEFNFYTKIEIKRILHKQLKDSLCKVDLNCTCILPLIAKDGRSSSFDMTGLLKEIIREHDIEIFIDTIKTDFRFVDEDIENIILFEDISGTGGTVIKFLKDNTKFLEGKKVILNLIATTVSAKREIEEYLKHSRIDIELVVEHQYSKVFLKHPSLNETHRQLIYKFEEEIWGRDHNNILGYKDSQVLVGFSHNIPNNTLSSFWYHVDFEGARQEWHSLFKRNTGKRRRKRRVTQNHNIKKRGSN